MSRKLSTLLSVLMMLALLMGLVPIAAAEEMTDVGTPRAQTLIIDMLNGRAANVTQFNPYLTGVVYQGNGFRQVVWEPLWDVSTVTGTQFPVLAESMAIPLDDTYTKFEVKLRKNVKWSDGEDFTAADVVFTADMLFNTPELAYGQTFAATIKSVVAEDDYTLIIETHNPEYRLEQFLGIYQTDGNFKIVPKHIWENVDASTYLNPDNIATGPYVVKEIDPQGNWFLFEKRSDWEASATGQLFGEPTPQYLLFRTYGTEEKRVMAAIQNDMDILCDITSESWQVLSEKNPEAMAWYDSFPYANMEDSACRGIMFNCADEYLSDVDVRWALLLCCDISSVTMSSYSGMLRINPLIMPPTTMLSDAYHKPLLEWLKEFTLSDGYKPFDETWAQKIVEQLKQQGIEGLPATEEEIVDIFGIGWWKYDTDQAEKMLLAKGFSRNADGKWLTPEGDIWQLNLAAPSGFEVIAERMGYAIVDCWTKFGIDAVIQPCDAGSFQTVMSTGNFDAIVAWPDITVMIDSTSTLRRWSSDNMAPIGEATPTGYNSGSNTRWQSDTLDDIIDQLISIPPDDPKVQELTTDFLKEVVANQPYAAFTGCSKLVPVITHYWTGFPTIDNNFEGPWWWWSNFGYTLHNYQPVQQ